MSHPLPELQMLLLDLVSKERSVAEAAILQLDDHDWDTMLGMVRQHRLGPMLHWCLTRYRADLPVPAWVREKCARHFKTSSLNVLVLQQELLLVHRLLDEAGIRHIALKGAYLALNSYPQRGLRPLRDLDILVSCDDALRAFQVLRDGGCNRIPNYAGNPADALALDKHLPPLSSPSQQVLVELHFGLFPKAVENDKGADAFGFPQLWNRHKPGTLAGASIPYLAPTDSLLHLIVHAVYDHQFDNGPLLIADIAYLLESCVIDWSLFWHLAKCGNYARGCQLVLRLVERYWGKQAIDWPAGMESVSAGIEEAMNTAALLMLRNFEERRVAQVAGNLMHHSPYGRLAAAVRKLFPSKAVIATIYSVSAHSIRIYAFYPANWWRLLTQSIPKLLRLCRKSEFRDEVARLCHIKHWLAQ